jgi:adrenodoxin-NADP+ reductase
LEGEAGYQRGIGTGEFETLPAKFVLVSIGYKANIIPGTEQWFDSVRGVIKNLHGLVDGPTSSGLGGLYVSGWLKRGPTGIIGTNIVDAKDTVATIMKDVEDKHVHRSINLDQEEDTESLLSILGKRGVQFVGWDGYQRIVDREKEIRRSDKQPREKLTNVAEMLQAARKV